MANGLLEARVDALIARYRQAASLTRIEREGREELAARVVELSDENRKLKEQVDLMGRDRFELKKLRDERKQIRRKLETAMTRIEALERELLS